LVQEGAERLGAVAALDVSYVDEVGSIEELVRMRR